MNPLVFVSSPGIRKFGPATAARGVARFQAFNPAAVIPIPPAELPKLRVPLLVSRVTVTLARSRPSATSLIESELLIAAFVNIPADGLLIESVSAVTVQVKLEFAFCPVPPPEH